MQEGVARQLGSDAKTGIALQTRRVRPHHGSRLTEESLHDANPTAFPTKLAEFTGRQNVNTAIGQVMWAVHPSAGHAYATFAKRGDLCSPLSGGRPGHDPDGQVVAPSTRSPTATSR